MSAGDHREFHGFGDGALRFLRALDAHNERGWFEANRERYLADLRLPLAALVEAVDVHLGAFAPEIVGDPRRSLFRIHRDIRFSTDKRPYKTNAAAWFFHSSVGRGEGAAAMAHGGAGFYFEMGLEGASCGGGLWMPPRPTLARIREAIDADPEPLLAILDDPARRRRYGPLAPEAMLKRMPRGYPDTHPAAALLRHQSFTLGRRLSPRDAASARLPEVLAREFERILPLVRWLNSALGLPPKARR